MNDSNYRVLIVDDELPVRTLMARALGEVGFECEQACNGEEAWQKFQAGEFHLVVTDLRMPQQHGHALCVQLLRSQPRPVIGVLTGVVEPRLSRDLSARGVDLIRTKPVSFRRFAQELHQLVRQHAKGDRSAYTEDYIDDDLSPSAEPISPTEDQLPDLVPKSQAKHIVCVLIRDMENARRLSDAISNKTTSCIVARSSDDLCQILESQRIDLLAIEHQLGGFLSGLDIIEQLNRQLVRPRVVLLAEIDDPLAHRADELGIDRILPPQTDHSKLVDEIGCVLSETAEHDAFIPPLARHLVKDFQGIPPLPQLVVKLAGYLSIPINEISIQELADDISADTKATTDLLKYTNNSSLGIRQTTSVFQAVNLHGPQRTISLILSAATVGAQQRALEKWNEAHRQWYQKRSVVAAATASIIAEKFEALSPDTAFVLGLVQDIGCLVLSQKFDVRYDLIMRRMQSVGRANLQHMEFEAFGVHHAHVSAALLQKWHLPQSLIRPVVMHHDDMSEVKVSKADAAYLRVMAIGEAFASVMDLPHPYRTHMLNQLLSHYRSSIADRDAVMAKAMDRAREICEIFSFPMPQAHELASILKNSSPMIDEPVATDVA